MLALTVGRPFQRWQSAACAAKDGLVTQALRLRFRLRDRGTVRGTIDVLVTLLLKTGAHLSTGEECPRRLKEIPNVRLGGSSRWEKQRLIPKDWKRAICVLYPR